MKGEELEKKKYSVKFYRDRNGKQPVREYLVELAGQSGKDARIKLEKIYSYLDMLETYGTSAGMPFIRHLEDEIWELRPLRDRILFVAWYGNSYYLLHHFQKDTQKTPRKEIIRAKKEFKDLKERGNVE